MAEPSRVSQVLAFLEATESLCLVSDVMAASVLDTQSLIAMELAWWHELIIDLELCEEHARKLAIE